jgi:hypothetical protein
MDLTKTELKLLAQVYKRHKSWQNHKYVLLIFCPILLIALSVLWLYLADCYQENPDFYRSIYFSFLPLFVVSGCGCGLMIGKLIRDWHGNAVDTLLLKVIENKQRNENGS